MKTEKEIKDYYSQVKLGGHDSLCREIGSNSILKVLEWVLKDDPK